MDKETCEHLAAIRERVAKLDTDMEWVKGHLSAQRVTMFGLIGSILALVAAIVKAI